MGKPFDPLEAIGVVLREHFKNAVIIVPNDDADNGGDGPAALVYNIGNPAECWGLLQCGFALERDGMPDLDDE